MGAIQSIRRQHNNIIVIIRSDIANALKGRKDKLIMKRERERGEIPRTKISLKALLVVNLNVNLC